LELSAGTEGAQEVAVHKRYPGYQPDQREFFDALITEDWETYLDPGWDKVRAFEIERLFRLVHPRTVLNVGCGCGYHDLLIADQPGVVHVEGIDYSSKSIETANREYSHEKVSRSVGDILEYSGEPVDLVVSFQVIEHVPDPVGFLEACRDMTRPGGAVAVFTPNRRRLENRFRRLLRLPLALEDPQHFAEYTVGEIVEMAKPLGLKHAGDFSYGLTFPVPRTQLQLVPPRMAVRAGLSMPHMANRFAVVLTRTG
jgi:2-polyprenyl-3-methyl-5-hydroxy-6-metoxy-1,4-benzoquinol methylase